jgi:hypothetical protein
LIVQIDYDPIAFRNVEQRQWPLTINGHDWPLCHAIWVGVDPADVPVKVDGVRGDDLCAYRQYWNQQVGQRERHGYARAVIKLVAGQ